MERIFEDAGMVKGKRLEGAKGRFRFPRYLLSDYCIAFQSMGSGVLASDFCFWSFSGF
jgi:hypothetical protein